MNDSYDHKEDPSADELSLLKDQARTLGITFSNNIGIETLREKIKDALEPKEEEKEKEVVTSMLSKLEKENLVRKHVRDEKLKLVRLRIANLNPSKKDLPGAIITVSSKYLGTVKKYVPFGEATDDGYHVPYCIYEFLKSKKFTQRKTIKDPVTKRERMVTNSVSEYAIDVLPPLTQEELAKLAQAQQAAGIV